MNGNGDRREVHQDEPVKAWKHQSLIQDAEGNYAIGPLRFPGYPVNPHLQEAECLERSGERGYRRRGRFGFEHPPEFCSCGFYGMKRLDWLIEESPGPELVRDAQHPLKICWLLPPVLWCEAEFFGRIIEGTRGYRAQYQRIMRVWLAQSPLYPTQRAKIADDLGVETFCWDAETIAIREKEMQRNQGQKARRSRRRLKGGA